MAGMGYNGYALMTIAIYMYVSIALYRYMEIAGHRGCASEM